MIDNIKSEPVLDFLITVDRSKKPTYPDWVKAVVHPELELTGPLEYYLRKVELWFWCGENQGFHYTTGNKIYEQLKKDDLLKDFLNLADLLAIREKRITVFKNLYEGKAVFAWKSVVEDVNGYFSVPCLEERDGRVYLYWRGLISTWYSFKDPALRFGK